MSKTIAYSEKVTVEDDDTELISEVGDDLTPYSHLRIYNASETDSALIKIGEKDALLAQPECDVVLSGLIFRGAVKADQVEDEEAELYVSAW